MRKRQLDRRAFLQLMGHASAVAAVPWSHVGDAQAAKGKLFRYPRPGDANWPTPSHWKELASAVGHRLTQPSDPFRSKTGKALAAILKQTENPFYIQENPGLSQSNGWSNAWNFEPSAFAVKAESAEDVAAAVKFAGQHKVRLVVKGAGHDYLGRSSAADALMIWTHKMRKVEVSDKFVPAGAPADTEGEYAVTVGAGTRWVEAYEAVTTKAGRYVQGGGCTTVGVAGGFTQGGGYGSFSKKYGTGAAGLLEVEIVTADGEIRIANDYLNPDLFWAIKGGGGGTFGIVTKMTLMTHPLPKYFGVVRGRIKATSDASYTKLIERFLEFYHDELNNEHWGEQFSFHPDNTLEFFFNTQGLDEEAINFSWEGLESWLAANEQAYDLERDTFLIPARSMWNYDWWSANHPEIAILDSRAERDGRLYWWAPNSKEVGKYWYAYQSRYIPVGLFSEQPRKGFAQGLFEASRHRAVAFHINKGLAGASADALRRGRRTSVNPVANEAAALVILNAGKRAMPGVPGYEPNPEDSHEQAQKVDRVMTILRKFAPDSGTYANEADFFTEDWQFEFWGENYPRLLAIKKKVDPHNLFHCHHSVGSEGWSQDQMSYLLS